MARVTLDRSRPFGTVHGEMKGNSGRALAFEQDGFPFGADGEVILELCNDEQRARIEQGSKKAKPSASPTPAKAQTGAAKAASKKQKQQTAKPAQAEANGAEPLNLEQFLRGQVRAQPFAVIQAVRDRYHKVASSVREAVIYLVEEEGLVPADQVDRKLYNPRQAGEAEPPVKERD